MQKDTRVWNLGPWGYLLAFYGILTFYFASGIRVDGLNVLMPGFAEVLNVNQAVLFGVHSTVGIIIVFGLFAIGGLNAKLGPRKMLILAGVLFALGLVVIIKAHSFAVWVIGWTLICFAGPIFQQIALQNLIANWFPTKKDLLNGWVTIGSNLATALFVPTYMLLQTKMSFQNVLWVYVGIVILNIIISFIMSDNPEDKGQFPDNNQNMTHEQAEAILKQGEEYAKTSPWTWKKILTTKVSWQIIIVYGFILMITIGMVTTIVPTLMARGLEQGVAVRTMSTAAIIAIPASWLWGVIGTKKGTKFATLTVIVVMILSILFMVIQADWTLWPATICLGCFLGAGNNLLPSMIAQVFGRFDFPRAVGIIVPIINAIMAVGPSITGIPLSLTGSYVSTYYLLLAISVICLIVTWIMKEDCIGRTEEIYEAGLKENAAE